jgi:hypothetical protein
MAYTEKEIDEINRKMAEKRKENHQRRMEEQRNMRMTGFSSPDNPWKSVENTAIAGGIIGAVFGALSDSFHRETNSTTIVTTDGHKQIVQQVQQRQSHPVIWTILIIFGILYAIPHILNFFGLWYK